MSKLKKKTSVFLGAALAISFVPALHAQGAVYIASTGSDLNPCTASQPCRSLNTASAVVPLGGTIYVMDTTEIGQGLATNLTHSVTLDGGAHGAFLQGHLTIGLGLNQVVTVRNLAITGVSAVAISGAATGNGSILNLENVTVAADPSHIGIEIALTNVGKANLRNVTVTGGTSCIVLEPFQAGINPPFEASVEGTSAQCTSMGLFLENGNITVRDSSFRGNSVFGIDVSPSSFSTTTLIENTQMSGNGTGFAVQGPATVRFSGNTFSNNQFGIQTDPTSTIISFRNNVFSGNGTDGAFNQTTSLK